MGFYDFLRFGGHFGLRALSLAIFSIPLLGMTLSGDGANAQSRFQSPTPSPSQSAAQPPAQPTVMTEADKKAATDILFRAVSNNDLATVQATIAAGANIEATNQWGIQPVELAVDKGYFEIAHFLLSVRNVRRQSEDKTQLASRQQASVFPAQPEPSLAPPPPAPGTPLAAKQVPVIKAPLTPKPDETITARTLKGPNPFDPATTPPGASLPIVSGSAAASSIARPRLTGPRAVASPAKPYVNQPRQPVSPTVKPAANQPRQSVPPAAKPAANQPAIEPITQLAAKPISQAPAPREELAEDPEKMDLADRFFTNIIEALEGKKPETKAAPQTAMVTQPKFVPVPNSRPKALPANHLKGTVLALGTSSGLGVAPGKNSSCVLNNQVSLCIETLQWPPEVAGLFTSKSTLYSGANKALVRYDEGRASRYHVLFPSEKFDAVMAYFQQRFGPPTGGGSKQLKGIGFKQTSNSIAQWLSVDAKTQYVTALEVRSIDDVRSKLPDVKHGVVMLVPWQDAPTLPRRTLIKLMLTQQTNGK